MIATLHFAESTFPLHFLFQRAERLLHIVIAHDDLDDGPLSLDMFHIWGHVQNRERSRQFAKRRGLYQSNAPLSTP